MFIYDPYPLTLIFLCILASEAVFTYELRSLDANFYFCALIHAASFLTSALGTCVIGGIGVA
jgi:hypothetical protein